MIPVRLNSRLGLTAFEPAIHHDERGFFVEAYRIKILEDWGIPPIVQVNHSRSLQRVVRGMHFQPGMGKLVLCIRGAILDVAVNVTPGDPQFGKWEAFELSEKNHRQVYVPPGFAHGFYVLSDVADVMYGCTDYWNPSTEQRFHCLDPEVGIQWPDADVRLSPDDAQAPRLAALSLRAET